MPLGDICCLCEFSRTFVFRHFHSARALVLPMNRDERQQGILNRRRFQPRLRFVPQYADQFPEWYLTAQCLPEKGRAVWTSVSNSRICSFRKSTCVSMVFNIIRWWGLMLPRKANSSSSFFFLSVRRAKAASFSGSSSPSIMALIISRLLTPIMSETTAASLMLAPSKTFCTRLCSRDRS
ncbi:hypothetical protein BCM02_106425 [Paenibacillus methanolicus]|uniref:Uncharacterized protein n=1 Tax=Paenibacillus methanolicus TaxID=582686 RepID=A0A5S5C483_9BACL|nr:hypothetical protein BCM02_106425 [Paenibacillus methanolicus]